MEQPSHCPLLYLFLAIYMWVAHYVDRVNFLRRLTPPPVTHDMQMELVLSTIFPLAIIGECRRTPSPAALPAPRHSSSRAIAPGLNIEPAADT